MTYEEMLPEIKPGRKMCRILDKEGNNRMGLKKLLTKCMLVTANGETTDKLGVLHVHAWPWSTKVREVIFEPPQGWGGPFAVSEATMRKALDCEEWSEAVALFHEERAR